jgi:hypothetical protein
LMVKDTPLRDQVLFLFSKIFPYLFLPIYCRSVGVWWSCLWEVLFSYTRIVICFHSTIPMKHWIASVHIWTLPKS